ncbi:MAG TPA: L-seryl-tRNA(Sec) selenium transferase [Anaerolineales bacterium]|nr:L-seryl-tRNA(Sec) selenium transferase [Anaerolineales bacterium]
METLKDLRSLPSIEILLQLPEVRAWLAEYGRPLVLQAFREVLEDVRRRFPAEGKVPAQGELLQRALQRLEGWVQPTLLPVINASGVILHTNLGRAPLSRAAMQAAQEAALGYSNLEYDLDRGRRGSRLVHAEALLSRLTGAEAALVVNNNAAAVLLALTALARRRAVVIARSQLVEIGGGFRVPDVMKQSGARLLEVGTTNRVHLQDYESALEGKPALFLRAHRSNFQIVGFTSEPSLAEMAAVAHAAGIPVVDDLGSGSLLDTAAYGLGHEPMVQESLAAGADLVCFSGDKLLGGPQAGIVVGRADLLGRLKKHPLARAIRADKLCLAALTATLLHYLKDEAEREVPLWRMIAARPEAIRSRTETWSQALGQGELLPGESTVGGGSLPGESLPTWLLALEVRSPDRFLARLRQAEPPVIARTQQERVVFDPRTVLPEQDAALLEAIRVALSS